jgi:biuret amidohydrolase
LQARKIKTIIVCGVTTEVCVHTTVREANDRGYHCIVVSDATASYNDTFHQMALDMVVAQNGIFGSTSSSKSIIEALEKYMAD